MHFIAIFRGFSENGPVAGNQTCCWLSGTCDTRLFFYPVFVKLNAVLFAGSPMLMSVSTTPRQPELAADYYWQHFREFLARCSTQYAALFGAPELDFIAAFQALTPDAQRLWLRMLNRKGRVFAEAALQYNEIADVPAAIATLCAAGFASRPDCDADLADWWQKANKNQLWRLIALAQQQPGQRQAQVQVQASATQAARTVAKTDAPTEAKTDTQRPTPKKSADKATLQTYIREAGLLTLPLLVQTEPLLAQRRTEPLQYLLFLYFGRIETDLSAFTLRDLGVLPTGGFKTDYQARYNDSATAQAAYFFAGQRAVLASQLPRKNSRLDEAQLTLWQQQRSRWPEPLDDRTQLWREKLCYALGRQAEKLQWPAQAIDWYLSCGAFPASERLLRLYQQQKMWPELDALLVQMQTDPSCDEEFYLAADFARRYRKAQRCSDLTQQLQQAMVLQLDELHASQPELGVCLHWQAQGYQAVFAENNLWLALFGLLLWPQLFESSQSAIYNEFERRPRDLTSKAFYARQQDAIEQQLALLANPAKACHYLLAQLSRHHGKANSIFSWRADLAKPLLALVNGAPAGALAVVLRKMAQDFRHHSTGFPDLLIWRETAAEQGRPQQISALQLIEVKAPGDSVRRNQLSRLFALRQLGFSASLCRLRWYLDPARVYAVIDVETTGGNSETDRITEIAIVKVQGGAVINRFSTLVDPGRRIPPFISKLTGITDAMVAQAPSFASLAAEVWQQLQGCLFVAHNVRFDYGFVRAELARCGYPLQLTQLCTVVESRRCFAGLDSYSLAYLCQHFAIPLHGHHRALADAEAAAALLLLINQQRAAPSAQDNDYDDKTDRDQSHEVADR